MRKRRVYLALVGLGIVIGGIVLLSRPEREPEDGGKKLSEWVVGYHGSYVGSGPPWEDAIYRIGTNAIPYLLKWIQYEQPAWKGSLYGAINFVLGKINADWGITDSRELRATGSGMALRILGPAAAGAVPELTRLANDPKVPRETASRATIALMWGSGSRAAEVPRWIVDHERRIANTAATNDVRQMRSNALEKAAAP